jgi:hypothetical protein
MIWKLVQPNFSRLNFFFFAAQLPAAGINSFGGSYQSCANNRHSGDCRGGTSGSTWLDRHSNPQTKTESRRQTSRGT